MKTPFSFKKLQEAFKNDTGMKNLLNNLAPAERKQLNTMLTDESFFNHFFNLLPESQHEQIEKDINDLMNVTEEALRLYNECRFFEARALLEKTISLYSSPPGSPLAFLDTAVNFATRRVQSLCYNLLGDVESELGKTETAYRHYERALKLAEGLNDSDTTAKAFLGMGIYFLHVGDLEAGKSCSGQALDLLEGEDDRWGLRKKILSSLSIVFGEIGQYENALECAQEAVELCEYENDAKSFPFCLNNQACLLMDIEDRESARDTLLAALESTYETKELRIRALILNNLAMCSLGKAEGTDEVEEVKGFLDQALDIARQIGSLKLEALTFNNLGIFYQVSGKPDEARESYLKALSLFKKIGDRPDEAVTLVNLGQLFHDYLHDSETTSKLCKEAIDIIETIRGGLKKEIHRISYAEKETDPYALMIDCLFSSELHGEALEYAERAKSRALLEGLSGKLAEEIARTSNPEKLKEATMLLTRIDEIQKNLAALHRKEDTEERGGVGKESADEELYQALIDDLREAEQEFAMAHEKLKDDDMESASLLKVLPLPAYEIQQLLDEKTFFVELYQTAEKLYLFVVTPESTIKVLSLDLFADDALNVVVGLLSALRDPQSTDVRSHEFIRDMRQPLSALFEYLIKPLKPFVEKYQRMIIAPHLFWHYIPFHALYDRSEKSYLCDQVEISYTPTASVLQLCLQKNYLGRERGCIFTKNNGDLPHADQEADLLAGVFSPGYLFKGNDAYFGRLQETKTPFDVLHVACHGTFNPDQPFLSSIDLSPQGGDERKTYLIDLFNLSLQCSLVTLSACDTGVSRITGADEIIGLSRGLFYAGAAAVMLSLWQVADKSTCLLMENFYWHYVKNGKTKTSSLQLAMQAVKANEEYAHPYYWAPFVVMGTGDKGSCRTIILKCFLYVKFF
jgi:Uncharacterized protein conserved in bacteria